MFIENLIKQMDNTLYKRVSVLDPLEKTNVQTSLDGKKNIFTPNAQTRYVMQDMQPQSTYQPTQERQQKFAGDHSQSTMEHAQDLIFSELRFPNEPLNLSTQQFEVLNDITRVEVDFVEAEQITAFNKQQRTSQASIAPFEMPFKSVSLQQRESIAVFSEVPLLISYMMIFTHVEADKQKLTKLAKNKTDYQFDAFKNELQRVADQLKSKFQKSSDIITFIQSESVTLRKDIEEHQTRISQLLEDLVSFSIETEREQLNEPIWEELLQRCKEEQHTTYLLIRRVKTNLILCQSDDPFDEDLTMLEETGQKLQEQFNERLIELEEQFNQYILSDDQSILVLQRFLESGKPPNAEELEEITIYENMHEFYEFLDQQVDELRKFCKQFKSALVEYESMISQVLNMHEKPFTAFFTCCDTLEFLFAFMPSKITSAKEKISTIQVHLQSIRIPHLSYEVSNAPKYSVLDQMLKQLNENIENFNVETFSYFPLHIRAMIDQRSHQEMIDNHRDHLERYKQGFIDKKMLFDQPLLFDCCLQQKEYLQGLLQQLTEGFIYIQKLSNMYRRIPEFEQELLQVQQSRTLIHQHLIVTQSEDVINLDLQDLDSLSKQCERFIQRFHDFFIDATMKLEILPEINSQFIRLREWAEAEIFAISQLDHTFTEKICSLPKLEWVIMTNEYKMNKGV